VGLRQVAARKRVDVHPATAASSSAGVEWSEGGG
jgi:hypothetical protein